MAHNILLIRIQGEKKVFSNLPGVGSQRTRTVDAMRREGWPQHCPLSYDQARCIHSPFVECYEKTLKYSPQMKWVSCTAVTSILRVLSSASKRAHLLESLSPLTFNVARFKSIRPTYLTHYRLRTGHPPEWGCRRLEEGAGTEFIGNSSVPGNSLDIHGVPQL